MSESITVAQYKVLRKKAPKYHNRVTVIDGLRFDSKKEAVRWQFLVLQQQGGVICRLKRQVRFKLFVCGQLICTYVCDFEYQELGTGQVVEDVKSPASRKLAGYRIKRKLMKALYGITIRET